jgi:hypothetical protein
VIVKKVGGKRLICLVRWLEVAWLPDGGTEIRWLRRRWIDPFWVVDHFRTCYAHWRHS